MVAVVAAVVIGAAVGWYNEATLTGDDKEYLYDGFAEYTARGMAFWCPVVVAPISFIAGVLAGAAGGVSRSRCVGLAVGIAIPLALRMMTTILGPGRFHVGDVWLAATLTGSAAGGFMGGSQISRKRKRNR
jgi:hypothetical protein